MALYDTRFGLPQAVADYLNQGLPDIYQNIYNPPSIGPITKMPVESKPLVDPLYPQTGGNAEGFSVYNPDPNMTRTSRNYVNPFPYDPMDDFGTSDYGYVEQPREGITGLLDKYVKGSLPAQLIGKTVRGLANMLPVSKAGIFQNELLGAGFMLDNTGRIVSNNYNTPEGIMAGYNPVSGGALNFLTGGKYGDEPTYGLDKAYDKRRETISNTLRNKYGMTDSEIEAAIAGEYEGDIKTDLIGRLDLLNKSQNLLNKRKKAADVIFNRKLEERRIEKEKKEIEKLPPEVRQFTQPTRSQREAIARDNRGDSGSSKGGGFSNVGAGSSSRGAGKGGGYDAGNFCFDPSTPIQMADGSTKEIKNIQLGDDTKGGEVTGVFQFKASDEIHNYKGVTVAGSHYVKEDGRFIMVKDSPLSVKIDKIPVVYSLDTSGRRIFINDIEFADYNGDGIAKGFLANAGVDITGFDKEVLRQVENRLI
jgi:hypothetical protein